MLAGILGATTIILGIMSWIYSVSAESMALYMKRRGYESPTPEELRACVRAVIRKRIHIKDGSGNG